MIIGANAFGRLSPKLLEMIKQHALLGAEVLAIGEVYSFSR
jgi:hypothetical protein